MGEILKLIAEVGLPIAGALVMGFFIFLVMKQLIEKLVNEVTVIE